MSHKSSNQTLLHYRQMIIRNASALLVLHKHFSAAKCSQSYSDCEAQRMKILTTLFMSDPDPSPERHGLAVTSPSRCFHAKGETKV